jgi:hypothetical protein
MDWRKLKVGTKVRYGRSVREVLSIEVEGGRTFLTYAHEGNVVPGRIEASRFSPGAEIIES